MKVFKTPLNLLTLLSLMLCISLTSCSKDDIKEINTPNNTKVETIDKTFFTQLKIASDEISKNSIWKDYDFATRPMYFIFRDTDKKAVRGYLINPTKKVDGAVKITGDDAQGLNVYRYDKEMKTLNESLKNGNDVYDFNFNISGDNTYYAQQYSKKTVEDKGQEAALQLATHEAFHMFQDKWTHSPNSIQDEKNYPINKDLLALQLLTMEIGKKMPQLSDKAKIIEYLKMYVAIRSKEMSLDPTSKKYVKNMANEQERFEGTARYVESITFKKVQKEFNNSFVSLNSKFITANNDVKSYFAFAIWYGTGAAATYMLKIAEVSNLEEKIKTKTPFDIAETEMSLTSAQKDIYLNKAKSEFNWSEIEKEAKRLATL